MPATIAFDISEDAVTRVRTNARRTGVRVEARVGNVFDEAGAVREQFILRRAQTKGGYERTVYLNKTLRRAMAEYRMLVEHSKPTDALFPTQKQAAFSANTMCQLFLEIYHACGLKDASSHSGRRTFLTNLANNGTAIHIANRKKR